MRKPVHMNGYRCFACAAEQSADYAGFECPSCGGNLEVTYDYTAAAEELAGGFGESPRDLFRYQALLPVERPQPPFPLRIGGTPLYQASRLGRQTGLTRLYLKDDSRNPSASLKDRASAVTLCRAMDIGASVVSVASTGNAGSSLACLCAALGMKAVVFVPESAPAAKLTQLLSYGAQVLAVRGNYDDAFDLCLAASKEFGWFNRSNGFNPFTREGKKTCAFEIWEDLGGEVPDRVVVPSGDGNILSGIWKGWRDLKAVGLIDRLPKVDCAQSRSSAAICQTVHRLRGNNEPVSDWSKVYPGRGAGQHDCGLDIRRSTARRPGRGSGHHRIGWRGGHRSGQPDTCRAWRNVPAQRSVPRTSRCRSMGGSEANGWIKN